MKQIEAKKNIVVTGGAGFIGSHMVDYLLGLGHYVLILDKFTYAGKHQNLTDALRHKNVELIVEDINNEKFVLELLCDKNADYLINLAAETHVDNSIIDPTAFIDTNIKGTFSLLKATKSFLDKQPNERFRFIHVSTDEVFGELSSSESSFTEDSPYKPNSPYSASKASADHLVRAWHKTYGVPTIITNCSNNFGPRQDPEKLIPKVISNALKGKDISIYGNGKNIREWVYVKDHCHGIYLALENGLVGQSYCLGGHTEIENIQLVSNICEILDTMRPRHDHLSYKKQIIFTEDRLGHDFRYALNFSKAATHLGYNPETTLASSLSATISFYTDE